MRPNLVLGLCSNYRLTDVLHFLESSRRFVPSASVALISSNMDEEFCKYCETNDVLLFDFCIPRKQSMHFQSLRFYLYRDLLSRPEFDNCKKIFLADVRDLIFQSDPFEQKWDGEITFVVEDCAIRSDKTNSKWIRDMYGDEVFTSICSSNIVCGGTVMGQRQAIEKYVGLMCNEIENKEPWHLHVGYDQGTTNYLARTGQIPGASIDESDTIVATVGLTEMNRLTIRSEQIHQDGSIPSVVHQWDRHSHLVRFVESEYGSNTPA